MMKRLLVLLMAAAPVVSPAQAPAVLAFPPFDAFFACTEHFEGQFQSLGDELGTDCVVQRLVEVEGRLWMRSYKDEGVANSDWFGWKEPVLSPCDCAVTKVHTDSETNQPGVLGEPPANFIVLERADGVYFLIAHIQDPSVAVGESVRAGQAVAKVGNNGYARNPHIHIGAWKGETPLQIRFDQSKMRLPPEFRAHAPPGQNRHGSRVSGEVCDQCR